MRVIRALVIVLAVGSTLVAPRSARAICALPQHCVCDHIGGIFVRAVVVEVADGVLLAEAVRTYYESMSDLEVGDIFGGTFSDELFCDGGPTGVEVGDIVLAMYRRSWDDGFPFCNLALECLDQCGPIPMEDDGATAEEVEADDQCRSDCLTETEDECKALRDATLIAGEIKVLPWTDAIFFGEVDGVPIVAAGTSVDLIRQDPDSCAAALPPEAKPPDPGPCNDSGTIMACSGTSGRAGRWYALLLLLALLPRTWHRRSGVMGGGAALRRGCRRG